MTQRRIAIVGAGPKAAAICAKAACLRSVAAVDIQVTVFERNTFGAHWSGAHGYTDGVQQLCTPAERDIGFPYSTRSFGAEIARAMLERFSWQAFCVEEGSYGDWVDRGRPRPSHKEFADYVDFCVKKSGATTVHGEVTGLAVAGNKWTVSYRDAASGATKPITGFDGVVITGTGPCANRFPKVVDPRVFDGIGYWGKIPLATAAAKNSDEPVVILGSGGTAAAVAASLVRQNLDNSIFIVGKQPALYARTDSFFENSTFRNDEIWNQLSAEDRRSFTDRLTRGAVWSSVIDVLSRTEKLSYQPGEICEVRYEPRANPSGDLIVEYVTSSSGVSCASASASHKRSISASLVVDATGFDDFWFASLLPPALASVVTTDRNRMREDMSPSLELPLGAGVPIHAPMLSQVVSPAYASLMALGSLSDAILRPYADALA